MFLARTSNHRGVIQISCRMGEFLTFTFFVFFWLLLCLLSKKNHPLFLTDNIVSWMEHQAKLNEKYMAVANAPVPVRPLLVESLVIFIFYMIFLMCYAVIINYQLFWKNFFYPFKAEQGVNNCLKPLFLLLLLPD